MGFVQAIAFPNRQFPVMALRQVQKHQAEFWDLFRFSWDPAGEGLEQTLEKVLLHVADCFQATGASLFLCESGDKVANLVARSGSDARIPSDASVIAGEGIAGTCLEVGRPMVVRDPKDHPLLSKRSVRRRKELGSALVIPLVASAGCIGVVNLSRPSGAAPFDDRDLLRAESVVRHIALTVENARLFAKSKLAAEEAKRLQHRTLEIIQSMGIAVIVVDSQERVTEANREALRLLGAEVGGDHPTGFLAFVLESLHEASRGNAVRRRYHEENTNRSWAITCTPLTSGGATAAIEEITEHEKAEREMARLNRLAEIGQMTAAIAHEIRNPLTSIAGAARLVRDVPEQTGELSRMIEEEAKKLNEVCEQFLDFARPMVVRMDKVDLASTARRLATQHKPEFAAANVHLRVQINTSKPIIIGDALRIEQVMRNLLLNALQACEPGGRVLLCIEASGFSVDDNGTGMDKETQQRLFAPFFTTKAAGTGLGLGNVRKIVEAHGGTIQVHSEPGKGSQFTVQFPETEE